MKSNNAINKNRSFNNPFKTSEVIFLLMITCIISLAMGYLICNKKNDLDPQKTEDEKLNEFIENYNYILENYYDDVDSETLLNGAVEGMLSILGDEYSSIISDDVSNNFNVKLKGNYEGVGIEIYNDNDNNIIISNVIENSPADEVGLKSGDIVKKIDNIDLANKETSILSEYIKNSENDSFKIVVVRNEESKEYILKRKFITLKSVETEIFETNNKKIGYIYISIFSNNTDSQFASEVKRLEKENIDSLIIDVRDNTGGHLTAVENIMSELLDSKHIIYQTEAKGKVFKKYSSGKKTKTYPIVILQNENSASASEMLSATLKEEYGATIIGMKSYGKGTVQELITLSNGEEFKFTTKKWLTPKGNWINEEGVLPDIEVQLSDDYYENPSNDTDNQLQKALEYLSEK